MSGGLQRLGISPLEERDGGETGGRPYGLLSPHDIIHIVDAGGEIDQVLDQRVTVGCFPWRFMGGEAAFCRFVAFV